MRSVPLKRLPGTVPELMIAVLPPKNAQGQQIWHAPPPDIQGGTPRRVWSGTTGHDLGSGLERNVRSLRMEINMATHTVEIERFDGSEF